MTTNTSRVVEEDLQYVDEEDEVVHVIPGGEWYAQLGNGAVPLVAWAVLGDGTMYGVVVEDGRVDVSENVEDREDFQGYQKLRIVQEDK